VSITVPPPSPEELPKSQDASAENEAQRYADETLDRDARRKNHGREQSMRDHVHRGALLIFWLVIGCGSLGLVVLTIHMVTPSSWHFLPADTLSTLKGVVAGAIASSVFTDQARKMLRLPPVKKDG
jgi:hypothetical protein